MSIYYIPLISYVLGIIFSLSVSHNLVSGSAWILTIASVLYFTVGKGASYSKRIPLSVLSFMLALLLCTASSRPYVRMETNFPGSSVTVSGRIVSQPEVEGKYTKYTIKAHKIEDELRLMKTNKKIEVYLSAHKQYDLKYGDIITFSGKLTYPDPPRNFGDFNYRNYYHSKSVAGFCYEPENVLTTNGGFYLPSVFNHIKKYVSSSTEKYIGGETGEFVKAIMIDDKSGFSETLTQDIRNAGISHVTAVSGMHTSLLMSFVLLISGYFSYNRKLKAKVVIFILLFYMLLTGLSPSVIRSVIMSSCAMFGVLAGRKTDSFLLLLYAAVVMLTLNPYLCFSPSFALSFLSTAGLILLVPKINAKYKVSSPPMELFVITLVANISTLPYVIWNFGSYSWIGFVSNLIIVPLVQFVFVGGALTVLLSPLAPLGYILGLFTRGVGAAIISMTHVVSSLPFGVFEGKIRNVFYLGAYATVLLLIFYKLYENFSKKVSDKFPLICYTLIVIFISSGFFTDYVSKNTFNITYLYVGQGDCAVINLPGNKNILIDTGGITGNKSKSLTYLENNGIKHLDAIIISHSDTDHSGALEDILSSVKVDKIYLSRCSIIDGTSEIPLKLAKEYHVVTEYVSRGDSISFGNANFDFIYPPSHIRGMDSNESSMVVNVTYKGYSFLFTGDIPENVEYELAGSLPDCTVLKVAHHGSKTSTSPEFVKEVSPKYAVISAGKNNSYSHPAPITVDTLQSSGALVHITYESSSIRFCVDKNGKMKVQSAW